MIESRIIAISVVIKTVENKIHYDNNIRSDNKLDKDIMPVTLMW